jgi:hypothetical protein
MFYKVDFCGTLLIPQIARENEECHVDLAGQIISTPFE